MEVKGVVSCKESTCAKKSKKGCGKFRKSCILRTLRVLADTESLVEYMYV